jgi:beta-glucuronidase
MIRTFDEHKVRHTRVLDGLWDFVTDPEDKGLQEEWHRQFPAAHTQMYVPACWNNELGLYDYRGAAWYRMKITVTEPQNLRILFHAVLGFADVYWDGVHMASHFGGYTPFEFIVKQAFPGVHELVVRTDSRLDEQTIPYHVVDWFHYGGIIRPVEQQVLPDIYIEGMKIDYSRTPEGDIASTYRVELRSLGGEGELPVTLTLDQELIGSEAVRVPAGGQASVTFTHTLQSPRIWDIGQPELYMVYVRAAEDDLTDRIGFRFISVANGQILLNGKEVRLQGVNRHEEHPEWGFAFPPKLMPKEISILKELGCNSVRGSHYPQSKYWLDLLDESGLVYWSEIPIWGAHLPVPVIGDPVVEERALTMIGEMIRRDYHHPSIMFWSVHNEIDTRSQEAYKLSESLTGLVRSMDTSRLVAYATMHPLEDIAMPFFDVIGINYYHGWYQGKAQQFEDTLRAFHAHAAGLGCGDKPVLMTEFGGAGIQGDTGWEPRLFSEDYQAEVLATSLRIFRNDPKIAGTYVWQFADIRGDLRSERGFFRDRARSFNNKGLLNEYRKPKLAYRVVRDIYKADRYPL